MAVISDKPSTSDEPTVVSLSDYYPYGMTEPGRSYSESDDYRYGYTGHEKENDIASGVYTTKFRLLDTRLGRWLSVDPLHSESSAKSVYGYCGGNPIVFFDPDGRIQTIGGKIWVIESPAFVDYVRNQRLNNPLVANSPAATDIYSSTPTGYTLGVAFTDKGTPFLVMRPAGLLYNTENNRSNCFGFNLAKGQLWILSGLEAQIIIDDELELAYKSSTYQVMFEDGTSFYTSDAHGINAGELGSAKEGDYLFFYYPGDNIPQHVAEIKSMRGTNRGETDESAYVELYHKDRNSPPEINRCEGKPGAGVLPAIGQSLYDVESFENSDPNAGLPGHVPPIRMVVRVYRSRSTSPIDDWRSPENYRVVNGGIGDDGNGASWQPAGGDWENSWGD